MSGILVFFDEVQRREFIQEERGLYQPFSDTLSVSDWKIGQTTLALLGFSESTINYIGLAKKGRRVATAKFRVEFSNLVDLQSISIDKLESHLNLRLKPYFIRASRGVGGVLPDATWEDVIAEIRNERPAASPDIERLISLARYSSYHLRGEIADIFVQERDALGIALDIFSGSNKLRNSVLSEWAPDERSVTEVNESDSTAQLVRGESADRLSFLSGIPERFIQEESAIQHDLFNFNGATPVHSSGTSVFIQGARRLDVIYANKNSLESTLGVDLIYYHEQYDLFALVQYKLMRKEREGMVYRPDPQLTSELARMDKVYNDVRRMTPIQSHVEYRLNDDGFMFKLVPNYGLQPASGELIKGMYIPREYMHFLLGPKGQKGAKGGSLITFDGAPRYLTNSEFTHGINSGRIGTNGTQSKKVKEVVHRYYETGRAVLVAYESIQNEQETVPTEFM